MNKIVKVGSKICALSLVLITLVGCGKIPVLENGQEAVATMKEGNISANDLYEKIKNTYGKSVIIDMIDHIIFDEKDKTTEEETNYIKEQIESLESTAKQYNVTLDYLIAYYYGINSREELNNYLSLSYRRQQAVEEYVAKGLTDKEINKYYDENIFGDIKAKHILITPNTLEGMTTEETEKANKEALNTAKEVIKKLSAGEDFDKLVKEYSEDEATKNKNGDLGWFSTGDMVAEFEEAAFALKKGSYTTTPVKTKYGYHIILKVDEKTKPTLKDVKEDIIDTLVTNKLSADSTLYYKALEQIRKDSGLEIHDDELAKQYNSYMKELETPKTSSK